MSEVRHAAIVTFVRYGSVGLNWMIGIILARTLSVDERGEFALIITLVSVANLLVTAGADTATLRAAGGKGLATAVKYAFMISRNALLIVIAVALVSWPFVDSEVLGISKVPLLLGLLGVPIMVLQQLLANTLLGSAQVRAWAAGNLILTLVYGAGTASLALIGFGNVLTFMICYLLGYLISAGLFTVKTAKWLRTPIDPASVTEQRHVRIAVFLPTVLQVLLLRAHIVLLESLGETSDVGVLSVGLPFIEMLLIVPIAVSTILLPRIGAGASTDGRQTYKGVFLITLAGAGALMVVAPWLIPVLYGPEYSDATLVIWIVAPTLPLFSVARIAQTYLYGVKIFKPVTISTAVALVASVLVQLIATPTTGITGAAAAIAVGYSVVSIGLLLSRRRYKATIEG